MNPGTSKPSLSGIGQRERRPIALGGDLMTARALDAERPLPLLVEPAGVQVDLPAWLAANRERIAAWLPAHGGVLFRGFTLASPAEFERCVRALSGELLEYTYRSTPRKRVEGSIYTSTEYPADRSIPLHNEMSYASSWPLKIWFWAVITATRGGETPIADSRRVFHRIPAAIRDEFVAKQVMYVRNYGEGVDLPWQEVFQTSEKSVAERICRDSGIEIAWKDDDHLTTRQVCQATTVHPATGESVWFNQAHLFHVSSLEATARELLLARFAPRDLPRNAFFGDGSEIDPALLEEIRAAYAAETVRFPWQTGDLLLLDNVLAAHGRSPYEGPRKVLAGMAERWGSSAHLAEF
jgi:alpha-ketoglutarate-dependent taurine dioxygenase